MSKIHSFLLFLFFCFSANAQNTIAVKGGVYDAETKVPLAAATVYFSNAKDSTVIEYTTTDKNGLFKFNIKKYDKPFFLKVNYMGYKSYVEKQNGLLADKDFGNLYLSQNINELEGVVIKSEAPPVKMKKDTLEFNAASFKVRPDANVEALLKQLPGVEVDNDGNVTVNGKNVSQFLVNGKTFFDKNGAIILKNLPADLINKIQVSDLKTKKEELAREAASSDDSSINFTIDENKNKGNFGKFIAGYGSDNRYESSFLLNYFKSKRKISLLAASNNINSTGFTQDEVFDNMGGGRNNRGGRGGGGATGKGITQSNLVGFNYNDEWSKNLGAMASYNFSNTINKNESKSSQVELISGGNNLTDSGSKTRNENTGNKANLEFDYKINPTARIVFTPNISQSRSISFSESYSGTKDQNGTALNESTAVSNREGTSSNFGNSINFNKAFTKKSRNLSLVFSNSNSKNDTDAINISETIFHKDGVTDSRNQNSKNANTSDSYSANIEYTEPITDSLRVRVGTDLGWSNTINDVKAFNRDETTQTYSVVNDLLTNYTSSKQNSVTPKAGFTFEKSKYTFNFNFSTAIIDYDNYSFYKNIVTDLNQKYILPAANVQVKYSLDRSKNFTIRYDYSNSLSSSSQLLPVQDLSNPLSSVIGNPDLDPIKKNSVVFNYRNFDIRTRSGFGLFARGDYFNNDIASSTDFDSSGKRSTKYKNVSGTYTASFGGNWSQSIKRDAHVLRYGIGLSATYSLDKGFTNSILYDAKSLGFSPRMYLSYDYGDLLTVAPSYSLSYNESKYSITSLRASSNVVHRMNLQTTSYWPANWVWGNDFGYNYNSNNPDYFLWNTSLSYSFLKKQMALKVKVYDILNQNLSVVRTISATSIRDEENIVLKRYVMFTLSYKLGNFGGSQGRSGLRGAGGGRMGGGNQNF